MPGAGPADRMVFSARFARLTQFTFVVIQLDVDDPAWFAVVAARNGPKPSADFKDTP
jgi:hypothetical protein